MRHFKILCATAAALLSLSAVHGADVYVEPAGSGGFGSANPPPAGTQEFARDTTFGNPYYFDNASGAGRTIAAGGPVIDLSGNLGNKQIQPSLLINTTTPQGATGGDVDLFQVSVTRPELFQAWTARTVGSSANTFLLTLFASDGTAIAASLGGVQAAGPINTIVGAVPVNPADPGIIRGASLGLTPGNYYLGISNFIASNGKAQPKNDATQNIFTPVAGSVVTPNALADIKLSTDPLKAWDLYTLDTGTVGSFDPTTGTGDGDQLMGRSGFTSGSAPFINVFLVPEPASGFLIGMAGLSFLSRRRHS